MGEGFGRFRKKYLIDAIVKAVLAFFSVALLIVGAFLIVIAKDKLEFNIAYAVLIALASGLLLGLLTFFLSYPYHKRLAKRLDKELGLKEKIQTMYAFRDDEGELKILQREDAQAILDSAPLRFTGLLKGWVAFALALLLSFSVFMVALGMWADNSSDPPPPPQSSTPPSEKPDDNDEEEFEVTNHHKIALEALIKEVEKSNLQAEARELVIAELTLLLAKIDQFKFNSEMKEYVVQVIKDVRSIVNLVNTTYAFHMYAKDSPNENLQKLSLAMFSLNMGAIEAQLKEIRASIFVDDSRAEIENLKDELSAVLKNAGISETDKLYAVTKALCDDLADIVDHPTYTESGVNRILDNAFNATVLNGLKSLIPQQKINEDVKVYVVDELMRIFDITEQDLLEKDDEDGAETEEPNQERPEVGDAGFGSGDTIVGSDDIVIDPELNPGNDIDSIRVKYSDVIGRYDGKITAMLQNGEISEELAEILRKYFSVLKTPPSEN